jgi:hypothetical protein
VFLAPLTARAAVITGSVIGEGARPVTAATVQVVRGDSKPVCATTTSVDGTFSLPCAATGRYSVRASFGDLRPWQVDDIELAEGREFHLNFMLLPATALAPPDAVRSDPSHSVGFWSRRVPNPVLVTWRDRPITLRIVAIAVAAVSFPLGALTMLALGGRFGIERRRMSAGQVGDLVLNPHRPGVGERVTPVAVVGARGAEGRVSFGADEIAAALAERRYGLVFVALVIAPAFFALFSAALALAMLVGQEQYLLYGMLLVPAGFLLTPIMIGIQALKRRNRPGRGEPPQRQ